jgi:hypothetical protein
MVIGNQSESFVTRIDAYGQNLVYSTFIESAVTKGIAVDGDRRAYLTGFAYHWFAVTPGAYQTTYAGGVSG